MPTIGMAIYIAWKSRKERGELMHCIAVVLWIMANSTWMIGEFFHDDQLRPAVAVLFVLGIACVSWYYLIMLPREHLRSRNDRLMIVQDPVKVRPDEPA